MSSFQKDVQLLTDLQELISDAERTANMPGMRGLCSMQSPRR